MRFERLAMSDQHQRLILVSLPDLRDEEISYERGRGIRGDRLGVGAPRGLRGGRRGEVRERFSSPTMLRRSGHGPPAEASRGGGVAIERGDGPVVEELMEPGWRCSWCRPARSRLRTR